MQTHGIGRSALWQSFPLAMTAVAFIALPALAELPAEEMVGEARVSSPLHIVPERARDARGPAIELAFDHGAYLDITGREQVTLTDFPLPGRTRAEAPRLVELELERMKVLSDSAQVVVSHPGNPRVQRGLPLPEVSIFRGRLAGEADSRVFLSISQRGAVHGFIVESDQRMAVLSSGPHGQKTQPVIYNPQAIQPGLINLAPWDCDIAAQAEALLPRATDQIAQQIAAAASTGGPVEPPCRRVTVAIETDLEFTQDLFNGDMAAAADYVLTLVGAASEIFSNDINVEFEVVYISLWDEPGGPSTWSELNFYWPENMNHIERDLVHLFAASGSGGVAWLWGVCDEEYGYAASFGLNGSFPYPLEDFNNQNWDPIVVTHEFGHNFGAPHTHNYCPAVDQCSDIGGGLDPTCVDQVVCQDGTIMGYCHLCPGGLSNVKLSFHPVVRMTMLDFLNSITTCELEIEGDCELAEPLYSVVHVPGDAPTIEEAFWLVADGGEILVAPGTYTEQLAFTGWYFDAWGEIIMTSKSFHLRSTDGPEVTILDGSGQTGSVLSFVDTGNTPFTVEGFTITGGSAENGGGIHAADADLTVINCIFDANEAESRGGAIYQTDGILHIEDSIFTNNESGWSGGAVFAEHAAVTISSCDFVDNATVPLGTGNGAAIFLWEGVQDSTISDSTFSDNITNWAGAIGIANIDTSATVSIINCEFTDNVALESTGGGVTVQASTATIAESSFLGNYGRWGGAVGAIVGGSINVFDCEMTGNTAGEDGGGVFIWHDSHAIVDHVKIQDNLANRAGGIAVLADWDGEAASSSVISNTSIRDNSAALFGGGVWIDDLSDTDLGSTVVCGNTPEQIIGAWTDSGDNLVDDECPLGDLNGDGVVDGADLLILLSNWGECADCADCLGNLNDDCTVDGADLLILLSNWG